jgi:hypothetical protein
MVVLDQNHPILLGLPAESGDIDTLATSHMAYSHLRRIVLARSFDQLRTRGRMRIVAAMKIEGLPRAVFLITSSPGSQKFRATAPVDQVEG